MMSPDQVVLIWRARQATRANELYHGLRLSRLRRAIKTGELTGRSPYISLSEVPLDGELSELTYSIWLVLDRTKLTPKPKKVLYDKPYWHSISELEYIIPQDVAEDECGNCEDDEEWGQALADSLHKFRHEREWLAKNGTKIHGALVRVVADSPSLAQRIEQEFPDLDIRVKR